MFWAIPSAGRDDGRIDSTDTVDFPMVAGTIPQPIVTDELIAEKSPTQTLMFDDWSEAVAAPEKHRTGHRKTSPKTFRPRTVVGIGASLAAAAFVVWLSSGAPDAGPAVFRQTTPDAAVAPSPKVTRPKPSRSAVRRAEPVVLQSARPTRVAAPVPTVTVTATPRPTATPTPKPTSTPRPTPSTQASTPSNTPDVPVTPTVPEATNPPPPEEAQTTNPENFDDDA